MLLCAGQPQSAAAFLAYFKQVISNSALFCIHSVELNMTEGPTLLSHIIFYSTQTLQFYSAVNAFVFYSIQ